MSDALDKFLGEIDRDKLRVRRPTKFVFLCGGVILPVADAPYCNLRDYLWRKAKISEGEISYILAESAQQLYRDSGYKDLVTFEEDVARLCAILLIITESAGSLAELGAFSSNPIISPVLRILVSEHNYNQESFIRWGPIERLMHPIRDRVGVFNWAAEPQAALEASADALLPDIAKFIADHVDKEPSTLAYPTDSTTAVFYDIMWVIYLADAIPFGKLLELTQRVHPDLSQSELKRKLYTLRVARWVEKIPFGGQDYYFLNHQADPFQYGFNAGVVEKEPARKALSVRQDLFRDTPAGALARVRDHRNPPA